MAPAEAAASSSPTTTSSSNNNKGPPPPPPLGYPPSPGRPPPGAPQSARERPPAARRKNSEQFVKATSSERLVSQVLSETSGFDVSAGKCSEHALGKIGWLLKQNADSAAAPPGAGETNADGSSSSATGAGNANSSISGMSVKQGSSSNIHNLSLDLDLTQTPAASASQQQQKQQKQRTQHTSQSQSQGQATQSLSQAQQGQQQSQQSQSKRLAKSASPRPQRVRPVDAVVAARSEILAQELLPSKGGYKLRLTALPPPAPGVDPGVQDGPELHEGFYDFAKAVVCKQPSPRSYAHQLRMDLETSLEALQKELGLPSSEEGEDEAQAAAQPDAGAATTSFLTEPSLKDSIDDIPVDPSLLADSENARRQVEACLSTLEQFACETTVSSHERKALIDAVKQGAATALDRVVEAARGKTRLALHSSKLRKALEETVEELEEDNSGLRRVVQQMLSTEADLEKQTIQAQKEVVDLETKLRESSAKIHQLSSKLTDVSKDLEDLREEDARKKDTRDGCSSPMMAFGNFLLGTDEVLSGKVAQEVGKSSDTSHVSSGGGTSALSGWERPEGQANQTRASRRTMSSLGMSHLIAVAHQNSPAPRGGDSAKSRPSRGRSVTHGTTGSDRGKAAAAAQESGLHSVPETPRGRESQSDDDDDDDDDRINSDSLGEESEDSDAPNLAPLASSLPALIPFLDFSDLRGRTNSSSSSSVGPSMNGVPSSTTHGGSVSGTGRGGSAASGPGSRGGGGVSVGGAAGGASALDRRPSLATPEWKSANQEHLERHLVMIQEEHQQELKRAEHFQKAVDMSMTKLVVWAQTIHGSLSDFNSESVAQEVKALTAMQDAVVWLAKHPCTEWNDSPNKLEELLDDFDEKVKASFSQERQEDSEMENLRTALAAARRQADEMAEQLVKARSTAPATGGATATRIPSRRNPTSPQRSSRQPFLNSTGDSASSHGQKDMAIQCDLMHWSGEGQSTDEGQFEVKSDQQQQQDHHSSTSGLGDEGHHSSTEHGGSNKDSTSTIASGSAAAAGSGAVAGASAASAKSASAQDSKAEGAPASSGENPTLSKVPSALQNTDREAALLRLLRCKFVEGIDLTLVPTADRVLLKMPVPGSAPAEPAGKPPTHSSNNKASHSDDKRLSLKQLQVLLAKAYSEKRADDLRRDKAAQPRRDLYLLLQEMMRRMHGVNKVIHQKSWQLVESIAAHAEADRQTATFAEFLDGTRDLGELCFYLYCSKVLSNFEEASAQAAGRPQAGWLPLDRASRLAQQLFGDLPKALSVIQVELDKAARSFEFEQQRSFSLLDLDESAFSSAFDGGSGLPNGASTGPRMLTEDFLRVLLEGWRMSAMLLEKTVPSFSWQHIALAFMQADVLHRGWLDQHEVLECEQHRVGIAGPTATAGLRLMPQTSLGGFVYREVHRCSAGMPSRGGKDAAPIQPSGAIVATRQKQQQQSAETSACLKVSQGIFQTLEKTLEVYLSWLMHSDDLGDLAVYHSVKSRMYGFQKAAGKINGHECAHQFRCLLLLLLSHQFDTELYRGALAPDYLEWELSCLLRVLRESWRRGAGKGDEGIPDFGANLANLEA